MDPPSNSTTDLLQRILQGDLSAIDLLIAECRPEIRRFVELRMDPLLLSRVDPSDIAQEAILEIARRLPDFLQRQPMTFDVWIRRTAYQNLVRLRRTHVHAERRSVLKELPLSEGSSMLLVKNLARLYKVPLEELVNEELYHRVRNVLELLPEFDRDIILMRTCEGLDNGAVAKILDLDPRQCSKRFATALLKVRQALRSSEDNGMSDGRK